MASSYDYDAYLRGEAGPRPVQNGDIGGANEPEPEPEPHRDNGYNNEHDHQEDHEDRRDHMYHNEDHSDDSEPEETPRYLANQPRGRAANFYINGDVFFPAKKIVYNPRHFRDITHYLDHLTDKLGPRFGAVRKIHTPLHGHRIRDLRDLQENGLYVVAGKERFKPYQYDQITPSERKKSPPFKYDVDPVVHSRQFVTSGKINKCETHSILIKVWPNGGDLRGPRRVLLTPRVRPFTLPNVLSQVDEMLKEDCLGTVEKLYFLNGIKVSDVDQITQNGQYVACRRTERFKRARYNEQGTKNLSTSPRLERKFLAPLYPRSNNSTSQSSPEHSNASTQNSVNGYRRKAARRDDDQVFPAKPVKHTRSSEKVRTVDLDKDQGGVFKAKQNNRTTRGAREVQESRHTKTDLPVDQREAREVQEENIKGKDAKKDNPYPYRNGVAAKANSKRAPPPREKEIDSYSKQREQSATKIQAGYRGYKTRKDLSSQSKKQQPKRPSPDNLDQEEQAAEKIQAGYRGYQQRKSARNDDSARRQEEEKAAAKIQAGYRGHEQRKSTSKIPGRDQEDRAAAKIQAGFRGHQTRKSLRDNANRAEEDAAAAKIQAGFRGHQTRKELSMKESSMAEEERAATKIQAGFRGHQTRKQLQDKNEAATKIQSGYRGHQDRREMSLGGDSLLGEEERAAAKIQAGYRGYATRKQLNANNGAASQRQPMTPEDSYDELDRENDAAVKIQSGYRGYKARKDFASQRAAAK